MFKLFPCGADKIPLIKGWQQAATTDPNQHALWAELYKGKLAYWGIPTGPENDLLVLDVDVKKGDGFKSLNDNGVQVPTTMSQRTVSGGGHYLFKYPKDGAHHGNRAGIIPNCDVRGAGGYIIHYGVDSTPLADAPQWLTQDKLKTAPQPQGEVIKVAPEIAEGIINTSLEAIREAPEGESNNVLNTEAFKVGQLVSSGSVTREYAEQALFAAAKERGKPDYEAKATIESGLDGGNTKPLTSPFGAPTPAFEIPAPPVPEKWTPGYFSKADLFNTTHLRRPQLFDDWSTEDIHLTTADGGTGKTTLKLMEAICLALGERFLGFNCKEPGKTLFITGEDTANKLGAMIGMIASQMGVISDPIKLDMILSSIVVKKDADLCIISKDKQGFLTPNLQAMNKILEAVAEIQPKMIVFDPISSFWGSEAGVNDMAKAVGKFMGMLVEKSNACVEIINHMGKQSSSNKDMSQFAGRGGTGLPSNARVSRVLRGVPGEEYRELTGLELEDNQSAMMCNVNKFTDGSPLLNKPFLIVRQGYLFSRTTLSPAKQREEEEKVSDLERVFAFIKGERGDGKYPTQDVVVGHFMVHPDKISQARVKNALKMLQYDNLAGQKIKTIENPDVTIKDKAIVIINMHGEEV